MSKIKYTPLNISFNFQSRLFEELQKNPNRKFKIKKYTTEELKEIINSKSEDTLIKEYQTALKTMINPSLNYNDAEDNYEFFSIYKIKIQWDDYETKFFDKNELSRMKCFPNNLGITLKLYLYNSFRDAIPTKDHRFIDSLEDLRLFELNTDFDYISMQDKINLI